MPHAPTTRWCPTPEQLMILEEMYKNGLRTPNASQIQQITRQLSCYGRIEGKNVFYWFQNHKARDRQKLRRRLSAMSYHLFAQAQLQNLMQQQQQQLIMEQHGCLVSPHSPAATFLPPFVGIHQTPSSSVPFFHQAGAVPMQDAIVQEPATFLIGSESRHPWETAHSMAAAHAIQVQHQDWTMATGTEPAPPSSCRPLKTLDLFPTKSTELKEECISSKSSSSCTTTYY